MGHKIDESGLHFSEEKLNDLRNYSQPTTQRQLKSFLGLASYFRDHIEHFSDNVHDLQAMVVTVFITHLKNYLGLKMQPKYFIKFEIMWQIVQNYIF